MRWSAWLGSMGRRTEHALDLAERMLGGTISRGVPKNGFTPLGGGLSAEPSGCVRLRVVEVEAYGDGRDTASHARFGVTKRTWPMFEPEGCVYIYLCYGIHWMVNISAGRAGLGGAVLVRGAELVDGLEAVWARRGRDPRLPGVLAGPGKVGQALGAGAADSGARLGGGLWSFEEAGSARTVIGRGPRIGIQYAGEADQRRRWRLSLESPQVSKPRAGG